VKSDLELFWEMILAGLKFIAALLASGIILEFILRRASRAG
jgi:hypothetical protein